MRNVLFVFLFLLPARAVNAQQLEGKLYEEGTNAPVAAALVLLMDSTGAIRTQVFSDSLGVFTVDATFAGTHWIAIERIGYATVHSKPMTLLEDESTKIILYLSPTAVRLDPLIVRGRVASRLDAFYENRRRFGKLGIGDFFGREQLASWINQPVSAVMQSIPYLNATAGAMQRFSRGRRCQVNYYIDGVRMRSLFGQSIDDFLRVHDLEGMEVYRGQSQLPPEYSDAQSRGCPVVAFWTRRTK